MLSMVLLLPPKPQLLFLAAALLLLLLLPTRIKCPIPNSHSSCSSSYSCCCRYCPAPATSVHAVLALTEDVLVSANSTTCTFEKPSSKARRLWRSSADMIDRKSSSSSGVPGEYQVLLWIMLGVLGSYKRLPVQVCGCRCRNDPEFNLPFSAAKQRL